ncbi:RraA family protein [Deinococcus oregonensis]|uniref:Regulator of ribonuclease activity homolog n=1 Tax=Deinococcus oregonensis TaxID=1805970 RepID=A0ABV6AUI6_9DEIO
MPELAAPELLAEWTALLTEEDDLTCTVSDVLGRRAALGADFRPVWPGARFAGPAVTVRTLGSDLSAVFAGIEAAAPGSVLVIDSHGVRHSAFWGERTTRAALARGLRGAVIDGACRDVRAITALQFPVFSTGITPNAGLRLGQGSIQEPVALGGVPILPGDLILGDENGVVVVPQARREETLTQVREALRAEAALRLPSSSAPFKENSHDRI